MSTFKNILVVVDPTADSQPAVQRAALLARKTGARLEMFICAYDPQLVESQLIDVASIWKARAAYLENLLRRLHALAQPLLAEGLDVKVDARWDSPLHEGIVRKASAIGADLVVKDTHYHTALRRAIFTNTDWSLIRNCPVPLWLVKPRPMASHPKLLAAVDPVHERDKPAALDHEILSLGRELSVALGGELQAFHAFDIATMLAASTDGMSTPLMLPVPELIDAVRERHTSAVHELTDGYGLARDDVHVQQGGTRDLLLAITERHNIDLVVMGAVSRRGLARVFIGNTAEEVLDHLGCDLLVVKPPAIAAALRDRIAA